MQYQSLTMSSKQVQIWVARAFDLAKKMQKINFSIECIQALPKEVTEKFIVAFRWSILFPYTEQVEKVNFSTLRKVFEELVNN